MLRIPAIPPLLAAAALAAGMPTEAQTIALNEIYDPKDGLITLQAEPGQDLEIVTTETVPGKACKSVGAAFPVIALPAAATIRNGAEGAARGARAMSKAAAAAGANAIIGFRTSTFITRNGNPRLLMYGTLASCE